MRRAKGLDSGKVANSSSGDRPSGLEMGSMTDEKEMDGDESTMVPIKDRPYKSLARMIANLQDFDDQKADAIRDAWLSERRFDPYAKAKLVDFLNMYIPKAYYDRAELAKARLDSVIEPMILTVFDVVTDLVVASLLLKRGKVVIGGALLATFVAACLINALVGLLVDGKPLAVAMALVGLKPIYDASRAAQNDIDEDDEIERNSLNSKKRDNLPAKHVILFTHMIEAVCESIPASFLQFNLLLKGGKHQSLVNTVSFAASLVTTGYLLAIVSRDFDTDPRHQSHHPYMHGYVPVAPFGHMVTTCGHVALTTGMCAARTIAIGILSRLSLATFFVWILVELVLSGVVRHADGGFKFFASRFSNFPTSCLFHFFWYWLGTCAAPTILRDGHILGPHWYGMTIVFTLFVSNPAMIIISLYGPFAKLRNRLAVKNEMLLGLFLGAEALAILGGVVMLIYMKPRFRKTFYGYLPYRDYLRIYWWPRTVHCRLGDGHDAARATVVIMDDPYYWNKEQLLEWLRDRWLDWQHEQPSWYDDDFIARLKHGLSYFDEPNFIEEQLQEETKVCAIEA